MLPGLYLPPGLVSGRITSLKFVTLASSNSSTIQVPAEVRAGDLMFGFDRVTGSNTPTDIRWGSGWNYIVTRGAPNHRVTTYWKLASASDPGSTVTGMSGTSNSKRIWVLRANRPIKSATSGQQASQAITDGNPDPITVSASMDKPPLVVVGFYSSSSTVDPRTFTPTKDGENGTGGTWLAWKLFLSNPQDVTIDMDGEGTANSIIGKSVMLS